MTRLIQFSVCLGVLLMIVGCRPRLDGAPCVSDDNCPRRQQCVEGVCVIASSAGGGSGEVSDGGTGGGGGGATGGGGAEDAGVLVSDGGFVGTPASHDFGQVAIGTVSSAVAFSVSNTGEAASGALSVDLSGTNASAFQLDENACTGSLEVGGSCEVHVAFAPTALGAASGVLTVEGMPGGTLHFSLAGEGIPQATVGLSPASDDFGGVVLGSASEVHTFTLRNLGGTPTGVIEVSASGTSASEFILTNSCVRSLAAMEECTFSVRLAPTSIGVKTATIEVTASPGGAAMAELSGTGLSPATLSGEPSPAIFPATLQGAVSDPIMVTITNGGGAETPPLTTSISGAQPGDFAISSDSCKATVVSPNDSCTLDIRFQPQGVGSRNAVLTVAGAGLVPVVIALGGVGQSAAHLEMSPSGTVHFGDVATNGAQVLVFGVTNTGQGVSGAVNLSLATGSVFSVASSTCTGTLGSGASCEFSLRFAPSALGPHSDSVEVSADPGGLVRADVTGTGVAPGALTISPASLDFGNVVQGQLSGPLSFTVRNAGAVLVGTPSVTIGGSGQGFAQTNTCSGSLIANQTCTISVTFAPSASVRSTQSAYVQVTSSGGGTTSGSVTGVAQAPALVSALTPSASFTDTTVGSVGSTSVAVTFSNLGDQSTGPLGVSFSSSEFSVVAESGNCQGAVLPALGTCQLRFAFAPQSAGLRSGSVTVSASPGGSASVSLSGRGLRPANLALVPVDSADFGSVLIGSSNTRSFKLSNDGEVSTGALSFQVTGDDAASFQNVTGGSSGECAAGATLGPSSSCTMTLRFSATAPPGKKVATVTVSASPGGSPSLELTGAAVRPALLSPATDVHDFGTTEVGTDSSVYIWTLTNLGDVATGTLTTTMPASYRALTDDCQGNPLAAGASCSIRVVFAPSTFGPASRTVSVGDSTTSAALSVSGLGAWRLTVTPTGGAVETSDGRISSCTIGRETNCTTLYTNGSTTTLRARTANGSGLHFESWSEPSSCTGYGIGASCQVTMTASVTAKAIFAPMGANLVFVSKTYVPANLGSLAAYDSACNTIAADAGINNTAQNAYIAWMSVPLVSAASRLTAGGSFKRLDGRLFASNEAALLNGQIRSPAHLDELGRRLVGDESIWTGTNSAGNSNSGHCNSWSSNSSTVFLNRALANGGPGLWTDGTGGHTCGSATTHLLCLQNTSASTLSPATIPKDGKRVFRSFPVVMPTGRASANATCGDQAAAAGLAGSYRALLATTSSTAAANALSDTANYYRVDGTWVGSGLDIKARNMASGIWQMADGQYPVPGGSPDMGWAWTGASSVIVNGTDTSTCNNWTNTGGKVRIGKIQTAAGNFFDSADEANNCGAKWALYCVEQ